MPTKKNHEAVKTVMKGNISSIDTLLDQVETELRKLSSNTSKLSRDTVSARSMKQSVKSKNIY